MVIKRYTQVTHKLTEDLAELVIKASKGEDAVIYAVYSIPQETLIAELKPFDNQKLLRYGYKRLLDTSAITDLVRSTRDLQYKTKLEEYLYKLLKREEERLTSGNKSH